MSTGGHLNPSGYSLSHGDSTSAPSSLLSRVVVVTSRLMAVDVPRIANYVLELY